MNSLSRAALAFGLATAVVGPSLVTRGAVAAQTPNPCALLTNDEIQKLVPLEHLSDGVATAIAPLEFSMCRYTWGVGADRYTFAVSVNPAARMSTGSNPDAIKQGLLATVRPETDDTSIPDVGDAAVFRVYSPAFVVASAYLKGRIVQVRFDGIDAEARKGALVSLLKSAASHM